VTGPKGPHGERDWRGLPLVGQLLLYAATDAPLRSDGRRFAWRPHGGDERQFRWALDGGLAPLLHRAAAQCADVLPAAWRNELLGADLTARVRHAGIVDDMLKILDACDRLQTDVALLKGISVSEQFYPQEHLRPMADIDLLVAPAAYPRIENALLACGYRRLEPWALPGHQHGAPLLHVDRGSVIELHTRLFGADSMLSTGGTFGASNVALQSIASVYHDRPVKRLSAELQLAYIASSWFNDMTVSRFQPSFIANLFDAIYLLRRCGRALDWPGLLGWLDNDMARASLRALLTYLPGYGVPAPPPPVLEALASTQRLLGPLQLRLVHKALDRYLIGGRQWDLPIPPPVPGRYSPGHQFRKRILARLQRAAAPES
jgi:hypothetical protein